MAELCLETSDTRIQVLSHTAICRYPNGSCPSAVRRKNPTHHYWVSPQKRTLTPKRFERLRSFCALTKRHSGPSLHDVRLAEGTIHLMAGKPGLTVKIAHPPRLVRLRRRFTFPFARGVIFLVV